MLGGCMDFPELSVIIGYAVDYLDCLGVFGWVTFFYWLSIVILSVQLFRGMQK